MIANLLTVALPGVILAVMMRPSVLFWIKPKPVPGQRRQPPIDLRAVCLVGLPAKKMQMHPHKEFPRMNSIMLSRLLKFKSTKIGKDLSRKWDLCTPSLLPLSRILVYSHLVKERFCMYTSKIFTPNVTTKRINAQPDHSISLNENV